MSGRRFKLGTWLWYGLLAYVLGNVLVLAINPNGSRWHYTTHTPTPFQTSYAGDDALSLDELSAVLDEIDLAYQARTPTPGEQAYSKAKSVISTVFLPATFTRGVMTFYGYMGPATKEQQAFTLSVKKRYNYLAHLAIDKGLAEDGYLFDEEPSLSKQNGESFAEIRARLNGASGEERVEQIGPDAGRESPDAARETGSPP